MLGLTRNHYLRATAPASQLTSTFMLHILLPCTTSAMTASGNALWENLSTDEKHEVDSLAAAW